MISYIIVVCQLAQPLLREKMSSPNRLKLKMQLLSKTLLPSHQTYHKPRKNWCNHFGEGVYTLSRTWPQAPGQQFVFLLISSSIALARICSWMTDGYFSFIFCHTNGYVTNIYWKSAHCWAKVMASFSPKLSHRDDIV